MNKLKYLTFAPLLPERISERYMGKILAFSVINDNEGEGSVFGCCMQACKFAIFINSNLLKTLLLKNNIKTIFFYFRIQINECNELL